MIKTRLFICGLLLLAGCATTPEPAPDVEFNYIKNSTGLLECSINGEIQPIPESVQRSIIRALLIRYKGQLAALTPIQEQ